MSGQHLIALCTCPDRETALRIAEALVDRQLAACVNILPAITSVYRWQGRCETGEELLLLIKTRAEAYDRLEQAVLELHPYELPEIVVVPIQQGLAGYLAWIDSAVSGKE